MKTKFYTIAFSVIALLNWSISTVAQDNSLKNNIEISSFVSNQIENMPEIAISALQNKLNLITSTNGVASTGLDSRFILTANIHITSKDLTSTAPPMTALTLDVTFYVGDGIEGKKFASHQMTVKGVGTNETKAYLDAIKVIKHTDASLQSFITNAKGKIITYYNTRCAQIIKEAQNLSNLNQHEQAIYNLMSIPVECTDCYNKAMTTIAPIYKKYIDRDCKTKLLEATNLWNANQNFETATSVGELLSTVDPSAACIGEIKALSAKISKKIQDIDKREWNLTYEKEVGLQKDAIKAYRDVGVAYGNGQPKSVVYNINGWW